LPVQMTCPSETAGMANPASINENQIITDQERRIPIPLGS